MARLTKAEQLEKEELLKQGLKKCSKCGIVKSIDEFDKNKRAKDGLQTNCKECRKQYYEENKDKIKQYYEENKDKIAEQQKQYYEENKDKLLEQQKQYQKSDKGKKVMQVKKHNRRARKEALPDTLQTEEWEKILSMFDNKCALTGNPNKVTLEHFLPINILHGGTYVGNVYPCDASLNASKGDKNGFEWIQTQPEQIRQNFYRKLLPVLAEQNHMTVDELKAFTNWCFENKRTIEQAQVDKKKGLTSVDLFWQAMEKE